MGEYSCGMNRFSELNRRIAEKITSVVSTMWCAYIFGALALISFPAAMRSDDVMVKVDWVAQTFLQLVLISIIMVGQKKSSDSVEKMIAETHAAALAEFELAKESRTVAAQELAELKMLTAQIQVVLSNKAQE
jgi:hypothetical protein